MHSLDAKEENGNDNTIDYSFIMSTPYNDINKIYLLLVGKLDETLNVIEALFHTVKLSDK